MASSDLTDQHWEAARTAVHNAFRESSKGQRPKVVEPKGMLKFLVYHLSLSRALKDYRSSITIAFKKTFGPLKYPPNSSIVEYIRNSNCVDPSLVKAVRSTMHPVNSLELRRGATWLVSVASDQWFNSTVPIMTPKEMDSFCKRLTQFVVDGANHESSIKRCCVTILFGMLRSSEWRVHIVPRLWSVLAYSGWVWEEECFRWCLQHATELLDFTRGLGLSSEGLKWWHATLRFHSDKLDTRARDEVARIARAMPRDDRCYDRIRQEAAEIRRQDQWGGGDVASGSDSSSESYGSSESDESSGPDVPDRDRIQVYSSPVGRNNPRVRWAPNLEVIPNGSE